MKSWLESTLQNHLKMKGSLLRIEKIQGDASYRIYSRIILTDGTSLILMQMPKGKAEASEEINAQRSGSKKIDEIPFINIARTMQARGLPVPRVFWYDATESALLLEDLGTVTMATELDATPPAQKISLYRRSIDTLLQMQQAMAPRASSCMAYQRSFDDTLLNWEFNHFLEYGIEAWNGKKLAASHRQYFTDLTTKLTQNIRWIPTCFVHRDFQSRNLMIRNGLTYLIDFQDALLGPYLYDLVALLRDSYSSLDKHELETLVQYFLAGRSAWNPHSETLTTTWRHFHLVTIQRKLKDAGRFVYIDRVKGNPHFLKFIPTSLGYAKQAMKALTEIKECQLLQAFLEEHLPKWAAL